MRVLKERWGEVTIKKQSKGKNNFDKSKSYSIAKTQSNYSIEELQEVLELTTNLTEIIKFKELKKELNQIEGKYDK